MKKESVTVIITVWKRDYLEEQLQSLVNQSHRPEAIWIIQNENHITIQPVIDKFRRVFPDIFVIHSDFNFKFFGRFSLCSHAASEYILVIDDDVIPSCGWLSVCTQKCGEYDSIISCTGRLIPPGSFRPEEWKEDEMKKYCIGDNFNEDDSNYVPQDTWVDYGCNSYFFRTAWIRHFWEAWPYTFLSGEDIHLSASLMTLRSIPTLVPQQISGDTSGNLKKYYSQDDLSSWRKPGFIDIRESIFEHFIKERNWKPILWK